MRWTKLLITVALVAAACGGATDDDVQATTTDTPAIGAPASTVPETTGGDTATTTTVTVAENDPGELPPSIAALESVWPTNWGKSTIDLSELRVGIGAPDPRDMIRPIDAPVYEGVTEGDQWLEDQEVGILLELGDDAIFYPIRILTAHEIVNDSRDGVPFSLTYCPLCNTAVAFDRRVDGEVLRFGVSGLLRNSDLVMWDDKTTSLWQQTTGEGIVGEFAGTQLTFIPTALVRWADFKANFPGGDVLSRDSGPFIYGDNAYVGYTSRSGPYAPFFPGEVDDRYEALSRVVGVRVDGQAKAYPFSVITEEQAVNDEVNGVPLVVFWGAPDTADPLDAFTTAGGAAIGTGIAHARTVDGQVLTFSPNGDSTYTDSETGSTWNILGFATDGPLAGSELDPIVHQNEFWFAWAVFNPDAPVYGE